ncbi:MAG: hypothetical protein AAF541_14235 [Pseudomonadota bacterium]
MRKFNNKLILMVLSTTLALPAISFASGGIGGGFSNPGSSPRPPKDEVYEFGKSVYNGRAAGATKIKYCVKVDGELKKLKRKTARAYKSGSVKDFANALYDCKNPDTLALSTVERDHVPLVLYYLNKRFKLDLQDA